MKTKILVVEDDKLVSYEIKTILDKNGFDVNICDSYTNCIKNLDTFKPELILLDIDLSKKYEGIQIGSYLNSKCDLPFIYITGYTDIETLKRIQTTKPVGYLSKPFREIDIINNIELALYNKKAKLDGINGNGTTAELELEESKYSKPIKRALEYIDTNINQEIKTEELIRVSGWSKFHFIREFAKEVGVTPYQYIFDQKMKLASSKLKNTYQSVKEIAFDLGYTSNSSFTNAFVKHSGVSPSHFRKKYCR
ncbi:response regulator transcription factor [Psychroflexus sediminis]|uniref:Two component transcriptional regulator, AraC family n=1 Tax=Psychroflexus sediminis TaxID=470826 RepID=A0A1G7XS96_9FLAO|nr:DNA-binding response regulator [Psychroflexus sediminis]SDG87038.1 two component transcriptional regulator, AraC family [Psychroflexus sediminis]